LVECKECLEIKSEELQRQFIWLLTGRWNWGVFISHRAEPDCP